MLTQQGGPCAVCRLVLGALSTSQCLLLLTSPPPPGEEGKLRHEGGLEVVGPAFQVLQLQGPTSELIPPPVRTAELAMRKIDLQKSRTCSCPISVYWKFQTLSSPRELFNCKSKKLVVFSTSLPYIWWAACCQSKDCQLGLQQYAEDVTYETDLLLLCFGLVLTQRHTRALTTTKQNKTTNPQEKPKQMSWKRTPLEPLSPQQRGRGSGGEKQVASMPDSFWRGYSVGRDPWLAWWEDSSASCVLSHASLTCVLILGGLTQLHWGFCFKFQVLLDINSSWAIITRCYSRQ